jgi:hypothetical protein
VLLLQVAEVLKVEAALPVRQHGGVVVGPAHGVALGSGLAIRPVDLVGVHADRVRQAAVVEALVGLVAADVPHGLPGRLLE